jgi:hypothetical protein
MNDKWHVPGAILCGAMIVGFAVALNGRERVVPLPWGYAIKDRWFGTVFVCETLRPHDYETAVSEALHELAHMMPPSQAELEEWRKKTEGEPPEIAVLSKPFGHYEYPPDAQAQAERTVGSIVRCAKSFGNYMPDKG